MTTRTYLRISITLNILIVLFIAGKRIYYSRFEISPDLKQKVYADQYNTLYKSVYEALPVDSNDIVFLGTSITQGFPVGELMGPGYKNRGIGSNYTGHIISRLDNLTNAKKIFIEAGINDFIVYKSTVRETFEMYSQIVDYLGKDRCVVQSLLPVAKEYSVYADSIKKLNALLKDYCGKNDIDFIDLHGIIGNMGDSNSVDGIHPNGKVYKIWAEAIKNYLTHSP